MNVKKELDVAGRENRAKRESGVRRFFRETSGELRRVSWPTWLEARNLTMIVIIVLVIMAIFLWLIDLSATRLLSLMLGT